MKGLILSGGGCGYSTLRVENPRAFGVDTFNVQVNKNAYELQKR